jgi:hypothetical protein
MTDQGKSQKRWLFDEGDYLFVILIAILIISIFLIKQYGPSYDEPLMYQFADINSEAYSHFLHGEPYDDSLHYFNLEYYGTGYLVLVNPIVHLLTTINPSLINFQGWHLVNFSVFLFSVWIVFKICLKFSSKRASFIAALLYLTQPLLWGHGVMNPKDGVFLAAFVTAVYTGMQISEHHSTRLPEFWRKVQHVLEIIVHNTKTWLKVVLGIFFLLILLDRIYGNLLTTPLFTWWYSLGLNQSASPHVSQILAALSAPARFFSFDHFLSTTLRTINLVEFICIVMVMGTILIHALIRDNGKYAPAFLSGLALGVASSVRILGPAALFVVAAYLWAKQKKITLPVILCYLLTAMLTFFFLWPYLWTAPLTRLRDTIEIMVNFPWNGDVRFEGASLSTLELPWYYLPKLIGIQFTLPLLGLALAGIGISFWDGLKNHLIKREEMLCRLVPLAWFFAPLTAVMIFQPPMYDTFRQFLFITPPLFIFAAVGIDYLAALVKHKITAIVISTSLILPGIIAIIWLHPYEYVYYNMLVGWTGNIGRNYDNDYWGTSFCEAGHFIMDETDDPETSIVFNDGILRMVFILCTDDTYNTINDLDVTSTQDPDFAVTWSRYDHDTYYNTNLPLAYVVRRGSTIFSTVRGEP